ncbi:MAG: GEVED domain-containing protein [Kiritimatiellae bacterium]|jgi:uncharacterized repeat protein (TIGR01451 family)|nr:GEVED domain-containing protein [Kiritimatiellia bacterium]
MNKRNKLFTHFFTLAVAVVIVFVGILNAATVDGNLRVEVVTAYNLVVDSNAGTPSSYAPRSAYVGAAFHNDGTTAITDLIANIGNYNGGTGATPGIYPSRADDVGILVGPLPGGEFALTHEGGSAGLADATRLIPEIPAGGSITIYWLVGYDQLDENGVPLWGSSVKPFDDLWLEYDIWATADDNGTDRNVDITRSFTMRNEISASANKIFPNGANKVPDYYKDLLNQYVPVWTNAYDDGSVGTSITTEGIWYDLGNVGAGFDNNGDLVPDKNAWMQPVGNPAIFDSGAFRLIHTYAMVVVKLKGGGEQVLTGDDQLYFENIPENNGAVGYVAYDFMPLQPGARGVTSPYQEVASGNDNEKFNADYGISLGNEMVSGDALVLMDKTASVSLVLPGDPISYTVSYTNSSPNVSAGNRDAGVPLVIQDEIPSRTAYVGGSAASGNTLPAGYNAYKILYSTDGGLTWSTTEPAASSVTHIQWWLDNDLAPEDAGAITFTVLVDASFLDGETEPFIYNEAGTSFGNTKPFATDDAVTYIQGVNSLGDTVYADTGVGGGAAGNGQQDGTEPGISGIKVILYYDRNENNVLDADSPILYTTVTDSNGHYLFENLPDGIFTVVVDTRDTDLPYGYTGTTEDWYAVNLDYTHEESAAVSHLTADFGFAPALALTKTRNFSGNVYEGQNITYTLSVTNTLVGDGTGASSAAQYTVWPSTGATAGGANKAWINPQNAWAPPTEPDGTYAVAEIVNAPEEINLSGYSFGTQPESIVNVTLVLPVEIINGTVLTGQGNLNIVVATNGTTIGTHVLDIGTFPASGKVEVDITDDQTAWDFADFNGTTYSVQLIAKKQGNPTGDLALDSVGFRITTDHARGSVILATVPLDDIYDVSKLQFVSALPVPNSVTTNSDVGTLHWDNLGPIYPGGEKDVSVTFTVLEPAGNTAAEFTNTASVTQAYFQNGIPANQGEDEVVDSAQPAGIIGDTVWRDLDSNGVQSGTNETGIAGVTVQLYTNAILVATAVTDANGKYLFEGLTDNTTYTVTVVTTTLPGGSGNCTADRDSTPGNSTTSFTLNPAATDGSDTMLDADFGYNNISSVIRGTVWHDLDRDHAPAPESGEDLLGGITVNLYASNGTTLLATTNTAADGTYEFTGTYDGTYVVKVDATVGPLIIGSWTPSYDTDSVPNNNQVTVTVATGGEAVADYSYYLTGTLAVGDFIFVDWIGNGRFDIGTDSGLGGVTIRIYQDENTNGVVDVGVDALIGTIVTAPNGSYLFENLPAGSYLLMVNTPTNHAGYAYVASVDPDGILDNYSSVTITTTNLLQDFGYAPFGTSTIGDTVWYDANGDGTQSGATESGIAGATVHLYVDINDDDTWLLIESKVTDADGKYLFENLPCFPYRVTVDSTGDGIPNDAFGNDWSPTTPTSFDIKTVLDSSYLYADFGFAPLGAIGDTIYWDSNGNADQDWTEPGVPGVTVNLYYDNDGNKVFSAGDTLAGTKVTDSNGNYLFTELAADDYVVVVVDGTGTPLAGTTLTADPENDGVPCPIPAPDPVDPTCDGQTGVKILPGTFFTGADFGYQPPGVIGDLVWVDLNTNGVLDAGEPGIPYVPVVLYSGTGTTTPVATNYTDGDGYYSFGNLADGTYTVAVLTNDVNNPFPPNLTASYDADGTPDNTADNIVIFDGHITTIGGVAVTTVGLATDLSIDFGYRYDGDNSLSGTIGMDNPAAPDGLMNTNNPSGPGAGEYAFEGVDVYLYLASAGTTNRIASTTTDANGDYSFDNLPSGTGGDQYIVSMSAPASELKLTTSTGDTDATLVVNNTNPLGNTVTAYQVVTIVANQENIDFAFETDSTVLRDYGDLPISYSTTIAEQPVGPSHTIITNTPLYLGSGVGADANGQPSPTATLDTYEDGVQVSGLQWTEGAAGGSVTVTVGDGAGWLVGWIDFNQDGTFTNANEQVFALAVDHAVNGGIYNLSFDIPSNTFSSVAATYLNSRFRLYTEEPFVTTFFGDAVGGDVEDYQFVRGLAGNYVWEDLNGDGIQDDGEPGVSNVVINLYESDGTTPIAFTTTAADGSYLFNGLQPTNYVIKVVPPVGTEFEFTTANVGTNPAVDSDADAVGEVAVSLLSDLVRDDVDAGVYVPAEIFGYLFVDENDDQIRNTGDTSITNALVALVVDGETLYTTYTSTNGYYEFIDVPAGIVTVQVFQADANLVKVPDSTDVMRNRAISNAVDTAVIEYSVLSGYGVLAALPGEPLNFGYVDHPLSTRIDLTVYATTDGRVMIELFTVNENGNNDIEIYAIMDGDWVMVAMVPSEQVEGTGSHSYTVEAIGLTPGASYLFKIVDESGHIFYTDTPIEVALVQLRALSTSLDPEYFTMKFNTEPYTEYELKVSSSLAADAGWTTEYVQIVHPLFPNGVSGFTQRIQGAPEGTTTLRVPRNRDKAFFKLIKVE